MDKNISTSTIFLTGRVLIKNLDLIDIWDNRIVINVINKINFYVNDDIPTKIFLVKDLCIFIYWIAGFRCPAFQARINRQRNFRNSNRSSHLQVFLEISVLKNCEKFTGKQLCQSLLNKSAGLRHANLLKNLCHMCFLANFNKS